MLAHPEEDRAIAATLLLRELVQHLLPGAPRVDALCLQEAPEPLVR